MYTRRRCRTKRRGLAKSQLTDADLSQLHADGVGLDDGHAKVLGPPYLMQLRGLFIKWRYRHRRTNARGSASCFWHRLICLRKALLHPCFPQTRRQVRHRFLIPMGGTQPQGGLGLAGGLLGQFPPGIAADDLVLGLGKLRGQFLGGQRLQAGIAPLG